MARVEIEWTDAKVAQLRTLWREGHATLEIGRRMKLSKNAVVGKAHRLELPPRPSPIRPRGSGRKPYAERVAITAANKARAGVASVAERERRPVVAPPKPRPMPVLIGRVSACCWPLGEPGTVTFRFCDSATEPAKSYCAAHCALAYVSRREAA
jgi:GcrA cell cycle regulator